MSDNYQDLAEGVDKSAAALMKAIPEAMKPYSNLAMAAADDGEIDVKTKELMALAISIVIRCEGCMAYHMRKAVKNGATEQEVNETLAVAIEMGGGPAVVYAGRAMEGYKELNG